ncbi:hypothetical protein COHA_006115 [Chlorella ohadii]|uniref:Uroporphyrinogen decarboxylase n=1 Tax=Chlorella ohadii TaxID=2649997 RepID=A0AAD5H495_9CHLO|nr:hypothetical protein COHA_006115 [Chlorella ohadii]
MSSCAAVSQVAALRGPARPSRSSRRSCAARCAQQDPLLLRVARGEEAERTPVWLMRQAGRYMAAFREYSDRIGFRERSETASIAIELSLQPWRAFQTDGVIMFSDILTPLPALGIEFDVIKGKGPRIDNPIDSMEATLSTLRREIDGSGATLLGFIGTPWTLAAYSVEGKADRNCRRTKTMMFNNPAVLHALLDHLTEALIAYVGYQIEAGAQVVQLFDSWAHHLSPEQFAEFSMPYSERIIAAVRAKYPHVPLIFHANGAGGKHALLAQSSADVIGLDWECTMAGARQTIGSNRTLQGNVDPMVLFGGEDEIRKAVTRCLVEAGPRHHILNVGHGVIEGTPEESVGLFCDLARQSADILAAHGAAPAKQPNAVAHLVQSNQELKAAIEEEGDDEDRTFKIAIEDNIVTIAKYRAQVERLERELRELRAGRHPLGGQAIPTDEAAGAAGAAAGGGQQQGQQAAGGAAGSEVDTAMADAPEQQGAGQQAQQPGGGGMWM